MRREYRGILWSHQCKWMRSRMEAKVLTKNTNREKRDETRKVKRGEVAYTGEGVTVE